MPVRLGPKRKLQGNIYGILRLRCASLWMTNGVVRSLKAIPRPEGSLLLSDGQRQSGSDQ